VLGVSGGIDSAVVACVAADALGAERVAAAVMPSPHSSPETRADARRIGEAIGARLIEIPIQAGMRAYEEMLAEPYARLGGVPGGLAEENVQARIRGNLGMALSNKFGWLVLTTGNKSELSVGYSTLYGDMAGGLAVISDVPKTMVYELARWINRDSEVIPRSTIEKAPSAELKPNQKDQDTLPPYEVLDEILQLYVEENLSARDIIARGFAEKTVRWVQRRVDLNEYKREQAAPGLKVTSRAFGLGRRMPIAQKYVG
jgi:NAD+ synthetase